MPDTERGIIGSGRLTLAGLEYIPQVRGPGTKTAVNNHITVEVEVREDL